MHPAGWLSTPSRKDAPSVHTLKKGVQKRVFKGPARACRWFSYDEGRLPVRLSQREVALRLDAMGGLEQLRFNEYDRGDMHPEAFREFLPHWYARALAP